ncbi:hypothetical protein [Desulfurivibrio alkaliphilus]|uniref:Uncharacterized protein n=1 Tax=Desulfurivibrio alkaliphilus (strain DSM 19089 / UNIQEM U267 / AHT2) TaxID=589865 RepID=D6Z0I5_DESAT|nr:hypothetical protein [Desulfurivibrio alkaliphilus]ADH85214.1 hypothetical protein DaAHT2_0508 [Desulfurivibrio alkaliphilus AHT 2]
MILDVTSGVNQGQMRPERPEIAPVPNEANRAQPERNEAGQTSEFNPGVVTEFSAAAMELARPVTDAEQPADTTRGDDAMEREDRGVAQANREEQARQAQEPQRRTIDVMV